MILVKYYKVQCSCWKLRVRQHLLIIGIRTYRLSIYRIILLFWRRLSWFPHCLECSVEMNPLRWS